MSEKLDVLNRKDFIDKLIQLVKGFADKNKVVVLELMVHGEVEKLLYWRNLRKS